VTYRALTQIFGLDETLLHDLRDELLFQRLAVDEDGKGLVWTDAAWRHPPEQYSPPDSAAVAPLPEASLAAAPVEASRLARSAPEAERRQVTVLFCDLVDSTRLSQQLDAEDYRAVVRAYQEATVAALHPYDGYVAQYLGDGLLVYFGWPTAHEDAAAGDTASGGGNLVAAGSRRRPAPGGKVAGAAGCHESESALAATGETAGGA
jgi:class 3 adenylate cyclase